MTFKLKIIFSLTFVFYLNTAFGQNLKIKFYNKSGHDLHNLNILGKDVGLLKSGDSTSYLKFDSLAFCGNAPCGIVSGKIDKLKMYTGPVGYCGTGSEKIKEGEYKCDIVLSTWYDKGHILPVNPHK